MNKNGIHLVDIIVKPKELVAYCRERGLEINGYSRSSFVSYKVSLLSFD